LGSGNRYGVLVLDLDVAPNDVDTNDDGGQDYEVNQQTPAGAKAEGADEDAAHDRKSRGCQHSLGLDL
jgi:hypothetical protein